MEMQEVLHTLCGLIHPVPEKWLFDFFSYSMWSFPAFRWEGKWDSSGKAWPRLHHSVQIGTQRYGFYRMFRNKHQRSVETCHSGLLSPWLKAGIITICWMWKLLKNESPVTKKHFGTTPANPSLSINKKCLLFVSPEMSKFFQVAFVYLSSSTEALRSLNLGDHLCLFSCMDKYNTISEFTCVHAESASLNCFHISLIADNLTNEKCYRSIRSSLLHMQTYEHWLQ